MTSMIETYFTDNQPTKPEVFDINRDVINALGDPDCRKILEATYEKAKRASQILKEKKLPQTSLYRKLAQLEKLGLLKSKQYELKEGQQYWTYKCAIKKLSVGFEGQFNVVMN